MDSIENIIWDGKILATIIRSDAKLEKTMFFSPSEHNLQVGCVVYPAGGRIVPHVHRPVERRIVGTSEVIIVKKGRCQIEIFNNDKQPVTSRELQTGDILILVDGGHGFSVLEDTILLEVKQGPYMGQDEKDRF